MMMHAAAVPLVLLAVFTQAVYCVFNTVSVSTIEQCGPFQVNFSGTRSAPVFPLSLIIVPFSSSPISIPIPLSSWDNASASGSAKVTFLPLNAGTQFVVSLDSGDGEGSNMVSDVIAIQNSNNTSCLPSKHKSTNYYDIHGLLNQCSHFNVSFNTTEITNPPTIRAFLPRNFTFVVNANNDKDSNGDNGNYGHNVNYDISTKMYVLDIVHGFQAVLVLDDGEGHQQTSKLFTTGGNTGSVLSGCVVGITLFVIFVVFRRHLVCAGSERSHARTPKSFNFTEDVDMGSSFASRIRSRFSHFWASSASMMLGEKRSYRSDEANSQRPFEDGTSYGIPTSPRGSLALPLPSVQSASALQLTTEKTQSWMAIENELESLSRSMVSNTATHMPAMAADQAIAARPIAPYSLRVLTPTATAHVRTSNPDAPFPAVSNSPSSSRFLFGSGYLSSRSSRETRMSRNFVQTLSARPPSKFSPQMRRTPDGKRLAFSNASSPGYSTSRSSSVLSKSQRESILSSSSPLMISAQPQSDYATDVSRTSSLMSSFIVVGPRISVGSLRREGSRRDAGRMVPFPIVPKKGAHKTME
ncbi:hypothetical protein EW145_g2399 [Phellinidium pouzarii]|uniref:Membrane-associated protein n=1 Tax=Phellinidium pouzarii TaxID=167371 RepID=A0A4S4LB05_9AGAM|nr:hypothetical protein EW145_g2399 [Phellinidium pouzarii]